MEEKKVTCADDAREISEANVLSIESVMSNIANMAKIQRQISIWNYNNELMASIAKLGFKVSINKNPEGFEMLLVSW